MDTADLKDVASKPVLTGPYKITSFKKGETIELAAFADYWGGKPGLDTVTVKISKITTNALWRYNLKTLM